MGDFLNVHLSSTNAAAMRDLNNLDQSQTLETY